MRGRGRGGQNQGRGARGSGSNRGTPRTSTRNWERAPAGPVPASGSKPSSGGNRGIKDDDRAGLQWLPSVSRSSGLEPNGDALRSFETQQEYWDFITEKKSAYLSILYSSSINVTASFAYLLDAYAVKPETTKIPDLNKTGIGLLHFLQSLVDEFPSQRISHCFILGSNGQLCLPRSSAEWSFASDIAMALRRNNWWALEKLTNPQVVDRRLKNEPWTKPTSGSAESSSETEAVFSELPSRALTHLLGQLRTKVRSSAWPVLRSAYREVVKAPWLERSLLVPSEGIGEFMRSAVEKSEAVVKDTATDVWILRRPA
ncbi:hypothetical protein RSAG8_02468, partial [Rhizoctonia solani AG-8 WAC10335]